MDHGKVVAQGTSRELKQQIAGDSVLFSFKNDRVNIIKTMQLFKKQPYIREAAIEGEHVRLYVKDGAEALPELLRLLDKENIAVKTMALSEPTLDDVFCGKPAVPQRHGRERQRKWRIQMKVLRDFILLFKREFIHAYVCQPG